MRNRMYGGVRGRKTKVGEKLLRFPPTRLWEMVVKCENVQEIFFFLADLCDEVPRKSYMDE